MIKSIVVHLTGSEEDVVRLAFAEPVARLFDAHLTAVHAHSMSDFVTLVDPAAATMMQEMIATERAEADVASGRLKSRIEEMGIPAELRRLDTLPGQVGNALASETRTADLFLGTRPYGDPTGKEHVEEAVLFRSGRGCFFVPPKGKPPQEYATVFIAWKESRESARAVAESLPFLQKARQVVVGLVEEHGASEQYREEAGADIGRYLSRHGVTAEVRKIGGWADAGEALQNEYRQVGADLVVMGGYGHSRLREWILGGVTRRMLSNADIPVLMAH